MARVRINVTQLSAACIDPTFRAKLRSDHNAKPARFQQRADYSAQEAGGVVLLGGKFHHLADKFVSWLQTDKSSAAIVQGSALWGALHDHFASDTLGKLASEGRTDDAANLSLALRNFCERLAEIRMRAGTEASWKDVFLDREYSVSEIRFADGAVAVSGRLDALRIDGRGGLELVDYKLTRGEKLDRDLVQLAIYARLLRDSKHELTLSAILEYYEPDLHTISVPNDQLAEIFESMVAPVIAELASNPKKPTQKSPVEKTETDATEEARLIEETFAAFKLDVRVVGSLKGPQLVRYQLKPGPGVALASLRNRAVDLRVALGAVTTPAVTPGVGFINLDVPRESPATVLWKDLIERLTPDDFASQVAFPVGVGIDGEAIMADFSDSNTCHALVAGVSGSGKSEFLKAMVATLIHRNSPAELRLSIVDPKILTFGALKGSPYLDREIITDLEGAIGLLKEAVVEMDRRYQILADEGYENLAQRIAGGRTEMPYSIMIFDEFADLILTGSSEKKEFEEMVARIAGKGRAAGIHLVLATQRPDRKVVSGLIKSNLPLKICMRVTNATNSQIILDVTGGESLLGRGDLLCDKGKGAERAQSPFLTQQEMSEIAR